MRSLQKKLVYASDKEGLTVQNMLNQLVRQKIQYFERVKGNIQKAEQNSVDLSQFEIEEQA